MEYILDSALSSYELERLTGQTFGNEEFSEAIKNIVPEGHTFKAFPIQFTHLDTQKMIE